MLLASLAIFDLDSPPANFWTAWSFPLLPLIALVTTVVLYLAGWRAAHRTRPRQLPPWRAACFVAGIISLWIAIASPIDALDDYLLAAHMIQHFILMSIAPPLIVLGAPLVPFLRGVPKALRPAAAPALWHALAARWRALLPASRLRMAADEHRLPGMACPGRIRADVSAPKRSINSSTPASF